MTIENRDAALERAIQAAGGTAALARFINERTGTDQRLTTQAISQWKRCPPLRALLVELATADESGVPQVKRHELCPELYPRQEQAA